MSFESPGCDPGGLLGVSRETVPQERALRMMFGKVQGFRSALYGNCSGHPYGDEIFAKATTILSANQF